MATMIIPNLRHGYLDVIAKVAKHGKQVAPRGQKTTEILDAVLIIENPADVLPVGVGRKLNLAVGAAEAIQLVGAFSMPEMMFKIQPAFRNYAEDDGTFHGAYGIRIGAQMADVAKRLVSDADSRQAIVTLWDPAKDSLRTGGKRDYPCTTMLQFLIRDDHLITHTTMRSNDVWLGLAYDAFQFTQLQLTLARAIGVEPGAYHHHAVSLHIYDRDWEAIEELHQPRSVLEDYPLGFGLEHHTWLDCQRRAREVAGLTSSPVMDGRWSASELWYTKQLRKYL
jgi:thymidylate synthase